jgi:hypothetical protein
MPKVAKPARGKTVATMSDRIMVDPAFQLMLSVLDPHPACQRLNDAVERNEARIWCDDYLHDPNYFTRNFRIEARTEADGRPVAEVRARPGIAMDASKYTWWIAGVENLVQQQEASRKRGAGGAPRTYDHDLILIEAAVVLFNAKGILPVGKRREPTLDALCDAVAQGLREGQVPERTTLTGLLRPLYDRLISRK